MSLVLTIILSQELRNELIRLVDLASSGTVKVSYMYMLTEIFQKTAHRGASNCRTLRFVSMWEGAEELQLEQFWKFYQSTSTIIQLVAMTIVSASMGSNRYATSSSFILFGCFTLITKSYSNYWHSRSVVPNNSRKTSKEWVSTHMNVGDGLVWHLSSWLIIALLDWWYCTWQ